MRQLPIPRSFVFRDVSVLVRSFTVYVRPVLEYNGVIWSPCLKKDIDLVEKVQWRFTKRLHGFQCPVPWAPG